jgi:hypothetical protein
MGFVFLSNYDWTSSKNNKIVLRKVKTEAWYLKNLDDYFIRFLTSEIVKSTPEHLEHFCTTLLISSTFAVFFDSNTIDVFNTIYLPSQRYAILSDFQ